MRSFKPALKLAMVALNEGPRGPPDALPRLIAPAGALLFEDEGPPRLVQMALKGPNWAHKTMERAMARWPTAGRAVRFMVGGKAGIYKECPDEEATRW